MVQTILIFTSKNPQTETTLPCYLRTISRAPRFGALSGIKMSRAAASALWAGCRRDGVAPDVAPLGLEFLRAPRFKRHVQANGRTMKWLSRFIHQWTTESKR